MGKFAMTVLGVLAMALVFSGCSAKKAYPDLTPGWHSADYGTIFGRLQRVPSKNPDNPPLWIIRYAYTDTDKYSGKLNLTPPVKLTGFSGGELVQMTGVVHPEFTHPEFGGTWYEIQSIRLWDSRGKQ